MSDKNTINKYAQQVVDLLLADTDGYCEVVSDLERVDSGVRFETRNPMTGKRYRTTVTQEEI